jgi:hypothetical protein
VDLFTQGGRTDVRQRTRAFAVRVPGPSGVDPLSVAGSQTLTASDTVTGTVRDRAGNLSTKPLSKGTWMLRVTLDDGTVHRTKISLS